MAPPDDLDVPVPAGPGIWLRPVLFVTVVVTGVLVTMHLGGFSAEEVADRLDRVHPWGPLLLVALHVLAGLFFFPITVLGITAGFVYGPYLGLLYVTVAVNVAGLVGLTVGRLGGGPLRPLFRRRAVRLVKVLDEHGLLSVIALRMLQFLPFSGVNYALAVSNVRTRDYLLGTLTGMVPLTIAYVVIGASVGLVGPKELVSAQFLALFVPTLAFMVAVSWLGVRLVRNRMTRGSRKK